MDVSLAASQAVVVVALVSLISIAARGDSMSKCI